MSIIFRSHLNISLIKIKGTYPLIENLLVSFVLNHNRYNVACVYHPPHVVSTSLPRAVADDFDRFFGEICDLKGRNIILGDFNCPGGSPTSFDPQLGDISIAHDLSQSALGPTRFSPRSDGASSFLDLVFHPTQCHWLNDFVTKTNDPSVSDHGLVSFSIIEKPPKIETRTIYTRCIKRLDRAAFVAELQTCPFVTAPSDDPDVFCQQMTEGITCSLDSLVPMEKVTKRVGIHPPILLVCGCSRCKKDETSV